MVSCPICEKPVIERNINAHIDSGCQSFIETEQLPSSTQVASFFKTPVAKRETNHVSSQPQPLPQVQPSPSEPVFKSAKRVLDEPVAQPTSNGVNNESSEPPTKKAKPNAFQRAAPLAERMRPTTLDEVRGQELVGPSGVLRGLIESDRVPSMILWGNAGTGKTTIARVIANMVGSRFVEINSTSSGVAECKKIFAEAKAELGLTGRKTIIFCDEIHRFSKSQQDVFLGPVEAGHVTLIGATTENPSFKVQNALLSRCRTFTLAKLTDSDIIRILKRALDASRETYQPGPLVDEHLLEYLAAFADGDARTSLNLLELAMDLSKRPKMTIENLKSSLTKTLVYDRSGDQHYDTISAFHKSVRGSDPDAALYYLARMIQSGEDALYIARRMVVMASEDVGLADNSMLSLATATYTAAEKIGLPEARINLAHCAVALCLAPKSTRAYRGLSNAMAALSEPGIAGIPIPVHLRNAPTRLMKELGYGKEYKYNPSYLNGRVKQDYLPEKLQGRTFLEDRDLGTERDPEVDYDNQTDDDVDTPTTSFQYQTSQPLPSFDKNKSSSQRSRIGTGPLQSLSQPLSQRAPPRRILRRQSDGADEPRSTTVSFTNDDIINGAEDGAEDEDENTYTQRNSPDESTHTQDTTVKQQTEPGPRPNELDHTMATSRDTKGEREEEAEVDTAQVPTSDQALTETDNTNDNNISTRGASGSKGNDITEAEAEADTEVEKQQEEEERPLVVNIEDTAGDAAADEQSEFYFEYE